jgi:hypothetical protein
MKLGNTELATSGQAPAADSFVAFAVRPSSRPGRHGGGEAECLAPLGALARRLLALSIVLCALAVSGCASDSADVKAPDLKSDFAQREIKAPSTRRDVKAPAAERDIKLSPAQRDIKASAIHVAAHAHRRGIRRSDRALLAPQPAPDCEFKDPDLETADADLWAREKLDFERRCYQQAEISARNRLHLLQTSSRCGIEPVRYRRRYSWQRSLPQQNVQPAASFSAGPTDSSRFSLSHFQMESWSPLFLKPLDLGLLPASTVRASGV